jgi:nitroreductase
VYMEAGHVSQNVYLQAVSLNIGTIAIGPSDDIGVKRVLDMKDEEEPLYIMPLGLVEDESE